MSGCGQPIGYLVKQGGNLEILCGKAFPGGVALCDKCRPPIMNFSSDQLQRAIEKQRRAEHSWLEWEQQHRGLTVPEWPKEADDWADDE
jgi:hypothetical protein